MIPVFESYHGGRRLMVRAGLVAAAGLALTAVGAALDLRRALQAWLFAFTYWTTIAVAALILLAAFHAANARWPVVLRRVLEVMSTTSLLFLVLFIPVALGVGHLFPWVHPEALQGEARHLVEHKEPYLNVPFFLVRAAVYFAVWVGLSHLLHGWSVRQDREGSLLLTVRQRRLGAGALPLLAVTLSFAAIDWMMSLEPAFTSTIYGVYVFAGSFLSAFAVLILAAVISRGDGLFVAAVTRGHLHSLGKFLLAFTAFWAYIAISQLLLIWIANIPEEVPWYLLRGHGGWGAIGVFLLVGHFVVPFFLLLSRDLKRSPKALAAVAAWQLLAHAVDVYWLVMPPFHPDGPAFHLTDLTAFAGIGAAALAFAVWRLRGEATVPVKDPYLEESLRYDPP